jgi:hypothetical protein
MAESRGIKCFQAAHFLKSPSSKMKKSPHALVQILPPGGATGDFTFYPQIKNRQMTSSKNQPICSAVLDSPDTKA